MALCNRHAGRRRQRKKQRKTGIVSLLCSSATHFAHALSAVLGVACFLVLRRDLCYRFTGSETFAGWCHDSIVQFEGAHMLYTLVCALLL